LIAANFPSLKDEPDTVEAFLANIGLKTQLFEFAAEAVCEVIHQENANADIADLVLGIRNNAAFRALVLNGSDYGLFQHRSKSGKACITNAEKTVVIMVHNTDVATGLGAHAPKFMSKRSRPGTSYVHSTEQGELDLDDDVIELETAVGTDQLSQTKIDVCIFAEKVNGTTTCRIELLIDAQLNDRGNEFISCKRRFGMTFKPDDFVAPSDTYGSDTEEFDDLVKPRSGT